MGRPRLDPIHNWESKVKKTETCWLWTAGLDKDGYGKFAIGLGGKAQIHTRAHRFAYEIFVGPIPVGMVVCHRCDNPPCARPEHLFLGTPKDNNDDKVTKGRHVRLWGTPLKRSRQTHCKNDHLFDEANTKVDKRGHRTCRTCARANSLRAYYKSKVRRGDI